MTAGIPTPKEIIKILFELSPSLLLGLSSISTGLIVSVGSISSSYFPPSSALVSWSSEPLVGVPKLKVI